jgi:hypothetical protein
METDELSDIKTGTTGTHRSVHGKYYSVPITATGWKLSCTM